MPALIEVIRRHAQLTPARIALQDAADATRQISYVALASEIDRLAAQLQQAGCTRLGLYADNSIEWVMIDLAARAANICLVPLPTFFSAQQIAHIVEQAQLDTVLAEQGTPELQTLQQLFATDVRAGMIARFTLLRRDAKPQALAQGVCKITFTSGSTGNPKGVLLTQHNLDAVTFALVDALQATTLHNHLCVLPLSTLLENIAGVYLPLARGHQCSVTGLAHVGLTGSSQFDAARLITLLDALNADSMILTPQLLKNLTQTLLTQRRQLAGLQFVAVGGSKVSTLLLQEARDAGLPVYEGYGLSECGSVVALNVPQHLQAGSCGRPLSHVGIEIDNGEIVVTGNAFSGYLGDDAPHSNSARVSTGDLGYVDADGFLHVTGRRKNLIISSYGRNISPEWVESELCSENLVLQAMVFGEAKPHLGALVFASANASDDDIRQTINRVNLRLPDYARIKVWHRLQQPFSVANGMLTENLRIKRVAIQDHYTAIIASLYAHDDVTTNSAKPASEENRMSFYQQLTNATQSEREYLLQSPLIHRALNGTMTRQEYIEFLSQAYHHVKHTVPLLMSVGGRIPAEKEWLREAVAEYIEEELGHQEWILNDIEACGGDKEAVRNGQPSMATELMVSYAYDTVMRNNPVGFFGMVFVLEGTSINLACRAADSIQAALGLPNRAFTYLRSHGSLDIEHMHFFEKLMNRVSDENDRRDIVHAAQIIFQLYANIFRGIHAPQAKAA